MATACFIIAVVYAIVLAGGGGEEERRTKGRGRIEVATRERKRVVAQKIATRYLATAEAACAVLLLGREREIIKEF